MFGLGKKDKDGRQVRIEHRGKHLRASRTGGVAARVEQKVGPANLTANTVKGVRVSTRLARGARVALQNGSFRFIGRWNSGPLNLNVSKTGASASVKNKAGAFNFLKPQYSSFKLAGVQVRGKKAAQAQAVYVIITSLASLTIYTARLAFWLAWLASTLVMFLWDTICGFIKGFFANDPLEDQPKAT